MIHFSTFLIYFLFVPDTIPTFTMTSASDSQRNIMEDSTACEDMIFFERRLTEVITNMKPMALKWRAVLALSFLSTIYSAYFLILDPNVRFVTLYESMVKHPLFASSFLAFLGLFLIAGVHKRIIAPKIIAQRCGVVLADFCLSCDESGKLIVRPAYSSPLLNQSATSTGLPASMGSTSATDRVLNIARHP
uniref:Transmembrane protein 188 n=1 Tax=Panagrellus redivivus TaxID=6233 RepID=A0A7E4ZS33_PANRE